MVRIVVTPNRAKLIDFEMTLPSAVGSWSDSGGASAPLTPAQSPAPADPTERSGSGRVTDSQLLREVVGRDLWTLFLRGNLRSR
jgi:hypothetical protein